MESLLSVKLTFDPLTEQTCSGTKIPLQDTIAWFCHFGELSLYIMLTELYLKAMCLDRCACS